MKKQRVTAILFSLLLIAGIILSGCGSNEYLQANAVKRGVSFSFEYPSSFTKLTTDAFEDTGRDRSVSLLYTEPGNMQEKADIQIYIIPLVPMADHPDAAAWAEEQVNTLEKSDGKFELYERSTIKIAGIDGYKIVYFTSVLGKYLDSPNLICRDAYIDYQLYVWKISVLAVEETSEQAESVFEHLAESFEFLD